MVLLYHVGYGVQLNGPLAVKGLAPLEIVTGGVVGCFLESMTGGGAGLMRIS